MTEHFTKRKYALPILARNRLLPIERPTLLKYKPKIKTLDNLIPDLLSRPLKKTRDQDHGHQVSRPRPWSPGLETKTKTLVTRSRDLHVDQDLGNQVSRPRSYHQASNRDPDQH